MQNVQRWEGEQLFTVKSEVTGWLSVVSDDAVQSVDQIFVRDGNSQFQNFHVMNFHNFTHCSVTD